MAAECLFCKIITDNIPCEKIFENNQVLGFKDISPLAKEHYLFIHKKHTSDIIELVKENGDQLTDIFRAISQYVSQHNPNSLKRGFRIVTNQGSDGGQTIFHTHFHFLTGEKLGAFGS